jgi:hypothetical protein
MKKVKVAGEMTGEEFRLEIHCGVEKRTWNLKLLEHIEQYINFSH